MNLLINHLWKIKKKFKGKFMSLENQNNFLLTLQRHPNHCEEEPIWVKRLPFSDVVT